MTHSLECDVFLQKCANGSTEAYDTLKELLSLLECQSSMQTARVFLGQLARFILDSCTEEECLQKYFFCFQRLALGDSRELILLQLPSIFTPEQWSFTFYEGLSRYHSNEFQGQSVCELGCGNGWISIALASQFDVHKIYGLDINPRAIVCAKINLYLNGLDDNGVESSNGILDKIEFGVSDLLEYCKLKNHYLKWSRGTWSE